MSGAVSIPEAIARLRAFDYKFLNQSIKRAFYRSLDVGRHRAVDRLKRTKIGAMVERRGNVQLQLGLSSKKRYSQEALNNMRASTIPLIVRRADVELKYLGGFGLRGGLATEGFAALIESGGRTKSHQIKRIREGGYSRSRKTRQKQVDKLPPMTFQIGARWVSKRVITHPGSKVPRNPFLETGARATEDAMQQELGRALAESVREAGL